MSDKASPVAAPVAATAKVAGAVLATGSSWWDQLVSSAKTCLQTVGAEVFDKVEPIAAEAFSEGLSELETMALHALTKEAGIAELPPGPEKTEKAIIAIADKYQKQFGGLVASEAQQAVANVTDALGLAKSHILATAAPKAA